MGRKIAERALLIRAGIAVILLVTLVAGCSSPAGPTTLNPVSVTPSPVPSAAPTSTATPSPLATPTATLTATPTATPSPTPTPVPDNVVQSYQWLYKGKLYQYQLVIPQTAVAHYRSLSRSQGSDYGAYAISSQDRPYLPAATLESAVQSEGFGEYDAAMLVQAFVLSLQDTPGRDDSPKYPVETLLDRGGDSEDTSILAAALLNDLGYDVVLLEFPGHMAVGVKGTEELYGRYYPYDGSDYYYLESAIPGYEFGAAPEAYNTSATIYPMSGHSTVSVSATVQPARDEETFAYYNVSCEVRNDGADTARGISVHFTALALVYGPDKEWPMSPQDISVGDLGPGERRTVEATVKVPRSGDTQLACIVSGDNFDPVMWKGEQFSL